MIAPDDFMRENIESNDGIFDRPSFDMCVPYFRGEMAVDVGAHYGTWSMALCEHFFSVDAFEPDPDNYDILCHNTKGMPVIRHMTPLSDRCKPVGMSGPVENDGQSYIMAGDSYETMPLDSYGIEEIGFIKMDVEGHEWHVLKGGEETIRSQMPVLCVELNGLSQRYGVQDCNIIAMLYDWGYYIEAIQNKDYLFVPRSA